MRFVCAYILSIQTPIENEIFSLFKILSVFPHDFPVAQRVHLAVFYNPLQLLRHDPPTKGLISDILTLIGRGN